MSAPERIWLHDYEHDGYETFWCDWLPGDPGDEDDKFATAYTRSDLVPQWVPVGRELPIGPQRVWFSWLNRLGKRRTGAGIYTRKFEVCAEHEDGVDENPEGYDWKNETPYRQPGWYEEPHESDFYYPVGNVTHWMPLPPPPEEG